MKVIRENLNDIVIIMVIITVIWILIRGVVDIQVCRIQPDHTYYLTYGCLEEKSK